MTVAWLHCAALQCTALALSRPALFWLSFLSSAVRRSPGHLPHLPRTQRLQFRYQFPCQARQDLDPLHRALRQHPTLHMVRSPIPTGLSCAHVFLLLPVSHRERMSRLLTSLLSVLVRVWVFFVVAGARSSSTQSTVPRRSSSELTAQKRARRAAVLSPARWRGHPSFPPDPRTPLASLTRCMAPCASLGSWQLLCCCRLMWTYFRVLYWSDAPNKHRSHLCPSLFSAASSWPSALLSHTGSL